MPIPKIEVPTYELTLPSTDLTIKYRPFLVKEEKILYIALESDDPKNTITAIKQIVNNCTFNLINVNRLPIFDLEYIFLNIRAKSVGEIAKFKILCPDDKKTYVDAEIDLTKVNVQVDDSHTNKIIIDEKKNIGLVLSYPTVNNLMISDSLKQISVENTFSILKDCVDHIFEGEKIFPSVDVTKEELDEFLENLPQESFIKIRNFFESMPRLKHEFEVLNPNTNVKSKVVLTGISDFFE
jgi:hypothetical protein